MNQNNISLERAINGLEMLRKTWACTDTYLMDCQNCGYNEMPNCVDAIFKDALALLKAQEPKLVHVTADINHRKIGECPMCGKWIDSRDYPNYCGHCGQVVRWG